MTNKSVIYDFETLGTDPEKSAVLCLAALAFDESKFVSENPYTFDELVMSSRLIKFKVDEQVKVYKREIDPDTVQWWNEQPKEIKKYFKPSPTEDVPLVELHSFIMDLVDDPVNVHRVYTRGNTFDPIFLNSLMKNIEKRDPFPHWKVRDTRSMIDGMTYGSDIENNFVPDELKSVFIPHDPINDICMDVIRLQFLARLLIL